MGFSRVVWVRTGFAVLVVAVCSMLAFSGDGTLKVEIVDDVTGQVLPAMVCITSVSDGTFRTPANGRAISPYSTVPEMLAGKWAASDVGPPRLRSQAAVSRPTVPCVSGVARIRFHCTVWGQTVKVGPSRRQMAEVRHKSLS